MQCRNLRNGNTMYVEYREEVIVTEKMNMREKWV
jgi:hypothetical protein